MIKNYLQTIIFCLISSVFVKAQTCDNENFESGTTNGWKGFTGKIDRQGVPIIDEPGFVEDRHTIMSGTGLDPIAAEGGVNLPVVAPGGLYSMRLGNSLAGCQAERITKTFTVTEDNKFFLYKYAVVLQDPQHEKSEQPRFEVRVFDSEGKVVSCGEYSVRASKKIPGFINVDDWRVKPWTVAGADLSKFIGEEVTVEFLTTDCSRCGHGGYAYIDASCEKLEIDVSEFCPGSDTATLSITEGFEEYKWSTGETTRSIRVANPQIGDIYSVKVKSFTGCSTTITDTLDVVVAATIDQPADQLVCKGENALFSVTGTNAGSFYWPDLDMYGQSVVVTPEEDKTYRIIVNDKNGCYSDETTVKVTLKPELIVQMDEIPISCFNKRDGGANLTITGGTPPYQVEWSPGDITTSNIDNLGPGTYAVKVTDENGAGCSVYDTLILENPPELLVDVQTTEAKCLQNDGSATISISGGIEPYDVLWPINGSTDTTVTNLGAGLYEVYVTHNGGLGCTDTIEVNVPEPQLTFNADILHPRCTEFDGSVTLNVTGGEGPYTYLWTPGNYTTAKVDGILPGDYQINVKDVNGCENDTSITINPPPFPLSATIAGTDPLCALNDGFAVPTVTGGKPPYQFAWSDGSTDSVAINLPEGTHQLVVTDSNQCTFQAMVTLGPPPPLMQLTTTSEDARCHFNDGKATVAVTGGLPEYNYFWYPSGKTTSAVTDLAVGEHTVYVIDGNECLDSATVNIGPPPNGLILTLMSTPSSAYLDNGTASADITGGTPPYTFSWFPVPGNNPEIKGVPKGIYRVLIQDSGGCSIEDTITVEETPEVVIPNAFTPNNDGVNDTWEIANIEDYPLSKLTIYNRWGNEIYKSEAYKNDWAGIFNGAVLPSDTYYFVLNLNIGIKAFTGYVDILK